MALTVQNGGLVVRDGKLGTGQGCCCGGEDCLCSSSAFDGLAVSVSGNYFVEGGNDCSGEYSISKITLSRVFGGFVGSGSFQLAGGAQADVAASFYCEPWGNKPGNRFAASISVVHYGCLVNDFFVGQGAVFFPSSRIVNGICRPLSFSGVNNEGFGMIVSVSWSFVW